MITRDPNEIILAPAYDMLCTKIPMPEDQEEMALTINGRKRKLKKNDFDLLGENLKIPAKAYANVYKKFSTKIQAAKAFIDISFLPLKMKKEYKDIIQRNATKLEL